MAKLVKCEFCGRELDYSAPFTDPKHVFNKPLKGGEHKKACRECFRREEPCD